MLERTLSLIKPDAVAAGHIGAILSAYEKEGFIIEALEMKIPDLNLLESHYQEHLGKPFLPGLLNFMTSGPVVAVLLGGKNAIERLRNLHGATNPELAPEGTIRKQFGTNTQKNAVHGSANLEDAQREIAIWFPGFKG